MVEDYNEDDILVLESDVNRINNIRTSILEKLDRVEKNGIALLRPMRKDKINLIKKIVDDIPNIHSFYIGSGELKRVVLRYNISNDDNFNKKKVLEEADDAYKNGDYQRAFIKYKELLIHKKPPIRVYSRLGLLNKRYHQPKLAIEFLTVANELYKYNNINVDFTDLIKILKGDNSLENIKCYVKMKEEDFNKNNYELENIANMIVLLLQGVAIEEVSEYNQLTEEEKLVVLLVFVRECYKGHLDDLADKYLKLVEQSKGKTSKVKKLLQEVISNKNLYKNQTKSENNLVFVLTLKN